MDPYIALTTRLLVCCSSFQMNKCSLHHSKMLRSCFKLCSIKICNDDGEPLCSSYQTSCCIILQSFSCMSEHFSPRCWHFNQLNDQIDSSEKPLRGLKRQHRRNLNENKNKKFEWMKNYEVFSRGRACLHVRRRVEGFRVSYFSFSWIASACLCFAKNTVFM